VRSILTSVNVITQNRGNFIRGHIETTWKLEAGETTVRIFSRYGAIDIKAPGHMTLATATPPLHSFEIQGLVVTKIRCLNCEHLGLHSVNRRRHRSVTTLVLKMDYVGANLG